MKNFVYYAPTKVFFGKGREKEIGKICASYGFKKVLVVYGGKSAVKSGLLSEVENTLKSEGIDVVTEGGVVPNPVLSRTREIVQTGLKFKPDLLLAVGGGSVIDTAKVAAYGIADPETDVLEFLKGKPVEKSMPIACILTLSAAGSEMSDSAVITDDLSAIPVKYGTNNDFNRCLFAVLNPELTFTLPKFQIGSGVADIFMHTAERYFVTEALTGNHESDAIAEATMRNIIKYGLIGYNNPTDYEAMSEIMWTSTVSHNDITGLGVSASSGRGGDWAVHQMGKVLSALYDSTHGASLTALWGTWAQLCWKNNPERFVQFGKNVWGLDGDDDTVINKSIEMTVEWFEKVGQPTNINDLLGFDPDDETIAKIADACTGNKKRTVGQLKVLGYDDIVTIYKMARKK